MADEQQQQPEDELELTEADEVEEQAEQEEAEEGAEKPASEAEAEEEEFAIELEGDEPEEEATPLVRDLRNQLRAAQKEAAEYRKVNAPKIVVGKEPDLWEDCDGDPEKYKTELLAYEDRKRKAAQQDEDAEKAVEVKNQEYQRRFVNYRAKAAALPVKDFDEAEKVVIGTLPELLQSAIVAYAKDPAKVVYALAKHPARLAALAQENDPIKFVLAMSEMERSLKVVNRRRPPDPEAASIQTGTAQAGAAAKALADLEKKAASGDRTALIAYKAKQKAKAA